MFATSLDIIEMEISATMVFVWLKVDIEKFSYLFVYLLIDNKPASEN